jgi:hypothetical protein
MLPRIDSLRQQCEHKPSYSSVLRSQRQIWAEGSYLSLIGKCCRISIEQAVNKQLAERAKFDMSMLLKYSYYQI